MARSTINLNPDEYNKEFRYYPFMFNLDRYNGSFNTLDDPSDKICFPNETEDINLSAFNMITRINESKTLTKYISCECKYQFNGKKYNSDQNSNKDKCRCECKHPKKHYACEKDYFGILVLVLVKMINI